jgi:hypothetical protein
MDMRHGYTVRILMQVYISKTCSKDIRCSMEMKHADSARKCSMKYSMDKKHVHAAWRSGMGASWTCSFEMHRGYATRTCSMDMQ